MNLFLTFTKVDQEQRIVEGIASTEALDNQPGVWDGHQYAGDVVDASAIEAALPDYLKWANIREMHQASAVGTALSAEIIDGKLHLAIKVVDDSAWEKVKTRVYKGFSIGGRIVKAVLEKLADGTYIRRILELALTEISLVDRPANPDARILVFKMEAPMPKEEEQTQTATAPALDAETIARLQKLAGTLQPDALIKASADPAKIVAMIQQARNELEIEGDMDGASMLTQAITLIQQVIGGADAPAEEEITTETTDETMAAGETAVAAGAKTSTLRKAGRKLSGANLTAMENTVKTLLAMMASAGSTKAQKAMIAMGDGDDMAMTAKSIGDEFAKAVTPLASAILNVNDRLLKIEGQPAPGGPVLRQVDKVIAGQRGATPEKPQVTALVKAQLDNLSHLARTAATPGMRQEYQQQHDTLRAQYQ